uniref:Ras/Rap GTPase-activating protein SynGAP-like PH domain-containing protein n=1 Tax=Setaria digitata TaxID=48799 RepID=A0A915PXQ4_9BILA
MGLISNTFCGHSTKKAMRSSSLSLLNKYRPSYHNHNHNRHHRSSSSISYIQRFQPTKIIIYDNANTENESIARNNALQRSEENVWNDERTTSTVSYGHSTFRPYRLSPENDNSFRSSRSHESLLAFSSGTHMIDLDGTENCINPIHPSPTNVPNCFRLESTHYACRNLRERNRWVESYME